MSNNCASGSGPGTGPCGTVEMEHLAHIDTTTDESAARGLDVGHDEKHSLCRARHGRRETRNGSSTVSREVSAGPLETPRRREVGVERPAQIAVEALGPVHVGDREGDDFEFRSTVAAVGTGWRAHCYQCAAHGDLDGVSPIRMLQHREIVHQTLVSPARCRCSMSFYNGRGGPR